MAEVGCNAIWTSWPHGVIAVEPLMLVDVKFFGRHKGGEIKDGVLLSLRDRDSATPKSGDRTGRVTGLARRSASSDLSLRMPADLKPELDRGDWPRRSRQPIRQPAIGTLT
jgi:hypothetical protein